jgi:hypothetical protein
MFSSLSARCRPLLLSFFYRIPGAVTLPGGRARVCSSSRFVGNEVRSTRERCGAAIARQTTLANRNNNKFTVIISYARLAMLIALVCAGKMDRHPMPPKRRGPSAGGEFQTLVRGSFGIA